MKRRRPGVIYLHGFNSSPASHKARLFAARCQSLDIDLQIPALSFDPAVALGEIERCIATAGADNIALLVGSSLGGYYATWFAERHGLKAALVNPAVAPAVRLEKEFLGRQRNFHTGAEYEFTPAHVRCLRAIEVTRIADPARYFLLLQTGDEVLDYRLALRLYAGCRQEVQAGGSHSFDNFSAMIDPILQFAGLAGVADARIPE